MRRYDKWQRRKYNEGKGAKAAVNKAAVHKVAEIGGKAMARGKMTEKAKIKTAARAAARMNDKSENEGSRVEVGTVRVVQSGWCSERTG